MEVFGNVEALKSSIERNYTLQIKKLNIEKEKKLAEIDKIFKKEQDILRSQMKTATDAAVKKAHSMILSEEELKAKKEFEKKRDAIIESVFKEAMKQAERKVHTKEYLDFVKKNMPDGMKAIADSDYYKKIAPDLTIDKNMQGIKFVSEDVIYDFGLNNLIESKKDILRQEISGVLFK
ncbi:MAG: hypothetical protein ABIC04_06740 [Nanoarchaeota archaeon]